MWTFLSPFDIDLDFELRINPNLEAYDGTKLEPSSQDVQAYTTPSMNMYISQVTSEKANNV